MFVIRSCYGYICVRKYVATYIAIFMLLYNVGGKYIIAVCPLQVSTHKDYTAAFIDQTALCCLFVNCLCI